MPLVFVHGVATRITDDPEDGRSIRQRGQLFRELVFKDPNAKVYDPYWGKLGAAPSHQWASLPVSSDQRAEVFATTAPPEESHILAPLAIEDFSEAIDVLFGVIFDRFHQRDKEIPPDVLKTAGLAADMAAALDNIRVDGRIPGEALPGWLDVALSDTQFTEQLLHELGVSSAGAEEVDHVTARETYGVGDALSGLASFTKDAFGRIREGSSKLLLRSVRDRLHPAVGRFLGDVFVYLHEKRGIPDDPGEIPEMIAKDLKKAAALRTQQDPLIVVGHSFGGIILVDMLRSFQKPGNELIPGLEVDALVTVGSQVGVFEELGLLRDQSERNDSGKASPPSNVHTWINVYDEVDVLSFLAEPVFDGVKDYRFSSQTGLMSAHSSYFSRPRFYKRLRARLEEKGVVQ